MPHHKDPPKQNDIIVARFHGNIIIGRFKGGYIEGILQHGPVYFYDRNGIQRIESGYYQFHRSTYWNNLTEEPIQFQEEIQSMVQADFNTRAEHSMNTESWDPDPSIRAHLRKIRALSINGYHVTDGTQLRIPEIPKVSKFAGRRKSKKNTERH